MGDYLGAFVINRNSSKIPKKKKLIPPKAVAGIGVLALILLTSALYASKNWGTIKNRLLNQPYQERVSSTKSLVVKKIDKLSGSGEFKLTDPLPTTQTPPTPELQVFIDGSWDKFTDEVKIHASSQNSYIPIHKPPPFTSTDSKQETPIFTIQMLENGITTYETQIPLIFLKQSPIPFKASLPYKNNFTLNIYNQTKKLLLTKDINL